MAYEKQWCVSSVLEASCSIETCQKQHLLCTLNNRKPQHITAETNRKGLGQRTDTVFARFELQETQNVKDVDDEAKTNICFANLKL